MCADLGSRRIRDEIDAMEVLGIDPVHRLIMPRVLAATMVAVLLDAIVSVAGIAGGWFFAVVVQHGTTSSYFQSFNELSQLPDLLMALTKALVFGFVLSREIGGRITQLRAEVQILQVIIDETRREHEVSQIVDSEFFVELSQRAQMLRERRQRRGRPAPEAPEPTS